MDNNHYTLGPWRWGLEARWWRNEEWPGHRRPRLVRTVIQVSGEQVTNGPWLGKTTEISSSALMHSSDLEHVSACHLYTPTGDRYIEKGHRVWRATWYEVQHCLPRCSNPLNVESRRGLSLSGVWAQGAEARTALLSELRVRISSTMSLLRNVTYAVVGFYCPGHRTRFCSAAGKTYRRIKLARAVTCCQCNVLEQH
jgi:hypothetical protein